MMEIIFSLRISNNYISFYCIQYSINVLCLILCIYLFIIIFISNMKIIIYTFLIMLKGLLSDIVLSASFLPTNHHHSIYNIASLAYDWSDRKILNNTIFQRLIQNTHIFNQIQCIIGTYLKPSSGTGYNCESTKLNCTNNITKDDIQYISSFALSTTNYFIGFSLGLGFQHLDYQQIYSLQTDLNNDYPYIYAFQHGQNVDTYVSKGYRSPGYDINSYIQEIQNFYIQTNISSQALVFGLGINYTSKDWLLNMSVYFDTNPYYFFTIQMNYFENDTDCTIQNLLSQIYLQKRLKDVFDGVENFLLTSYVAISTIKLHPNNGINGVTNTFASCLWALDFIVTFVHMGGLGIFFYENLTEYDYQSAFTSANNFIDGNFTVNSLYYALMTYSLFLNQASRNQYRLAKITNNANLYNIKIWALTDIKNQNNVLIINKDMNPNLSVIVQLKMPGLGRATYFYIQASNILDTSNLTIAGYTYDNTTTGIPSSPNQVPQTVDIDPDDEGNYYIPIRYSQVAVIYIKQIPVHIQEDISTWNFNGLELCPWILFIFLLAIQL